MGAGLVVGDVVGCEVGCDVGEQLLQPAQSQLYVFSKVEQVYP